METKSRYEVVAELEAKKRDLIIERDGLEDESIKKADVVRDLKRQKEDNIVAFDRKIDDTERDYENFIKTMDEKKLTVDELIKSINDSLARFNTLNK